MEYNISLVAGLCAAHLGKFNLGDTESEKKYAWIESIFGDLCGNIASHNISLRNGSQNERIAIR